MPAHSQGTAIGVLPGLGPVAGVALILPLTFSLDPTAGLIMMAGIFYGSMYGGSTTAILLNIPGESASVVTAIDGYQLAKKGRAGATLTIVAVGSFVGGTLAVIGVMMFSSLLAQVAILFGPAEFFALTAGGLVVMSRISGGTLASALLPMTIGLMLGTIGQEAVTGETRFTFGIPDLAEGVSLVPVVVGLYGFAELMLLVEDRAHAANKPQSVKMRELLPTRTEWKRAVPSWLRGTFLGFLFGLVPGPAATLASFASYRLEKATSKYGAEIGSGAIEGVAGPGSRQQFRGHRLAGAAAGARHSLYADRGADDLGDAGAGHPARAAVDHPAPGNLLGPDRLGLYRQRHAAGAEYPDGRRLGQPAADSALSVHSAAAGAVRDRHLQRPQQHLRRLGAARRRRRSATSSTR